MDNESSEKIIRDAIQLCSEAIRTRNDSSLSGGLRNIAREKSPPSWLSPDTLVYEEIETPPYLKSLNIITIISTGTLILEVNRNLRGYYSVLFDYQKAEEWVNKMMIRKLRSLRKQDSGIDKKAPDKEVAMSRDEKDYEYTDRQLRFHFKDGGTDQFDFSKAGVSRKVFESFWSLWNTLGGGEYSKDQVVEKYEKLHGEKITVARIGEIVSNIRPSIINPRPLIKDRIEWRVDRTKKKWIFKIISIKG